MNKAEYTFIIYYDNYKTMKISSVKYDNCQMATDTVINEVIDETRVWKIVRSYGNLLLADAGVKND